MANTIPPSCKNMGLLIAGVKNKMRKQMNDRLKPYDLTAEQRAILLILCDKGAVTQAQLCELTSMEPSNLSVTLKRLKNKNYIEKADHPNDPRAYLVQATESARNIADTLEQLSTTFGTDFLKDIDSGALKITCETLRKIDNNLKEKA